MGWRLPYPSRDCCPVRDAPGRAQVARHHHLASAPPRHARLPRIHIEGERPRAGRTGRLGPVRCLSQWIRENRVASSAREPKTSRLADHVSGGRRDGRFLSPRVGWPSDGGSLWPPAGSGVLTPPTWLSRHPEPVAVPWPYIGWVASTLLCLPWWSFTGRGGEAATSLTRVRRARRFSSDWSLRAAPAIEQALDRAIGPRWRHAGAARSIATHPPWGRIVFAPLPLLHPGVMRIANLSYGDAGRRNRLDLYRRRGGGNGGPVLIHLHGRLLVRAGAQELLRAAAAVPARPPGLGLHQRDLPTTARSHLPRRAC